MCNLYSTRALRDEVRATFAVSSDYTREIAVEKDYTPPGKPGLVVREEAGARVLDTIIWGFPFQGPSRARRSGWRSRSRCAATAFAPARSDL